MNIKIQLKSFAFVLLFICSTLISSAQTNDAGAYMNTLGIQYRKMQEDIMSYTSAVAHGSSARKVEKRRQEMLLTVKEAQKQIAAMQPYNGDKSLRDSAAAYLRKSYHVLNDDYGQIVNLEEIAEQSYDAMEAYYLAQDRADEKLKEAFKGLSETEKTFAKTNNVNLIQSEDDLSKKIAISSMVNDYHRKVYLIFFKSYKQEKYLLDAINTKNVNGIEQNKNAMVKYAEEGLAKLDTMKAFNGDKNLIIACRTLLEFHRTEGKDKIPVITAYFIKTENFDKIKKAYDAKKQNERKQEDVDKYNNAITELNKGVADYNTTNNALNETRSKLIEGWNKASEQFLDKHTPKYK